jgi:hypothetical protein
MPLAMLSWRSAGRREPRRPHSPGGRAPWRPPRAPPGREQPSDPALLGKLLASCTPASSWLRAPRRPCALAPEDAAAPVPARLGRRARAVVILPHVVPGIGVCLDGRKAGARGRAPRRAQQPARPTRGPGSSTPDVIWGCPVEMLLLPLSCHVCCDITESLLMHVLQLDGRMIVYVYTHERT